MPAHEVIELESPSASAGLAGSTTFAGGARSAADLEELAMELDLNHLVLTFALGSAALFLARGLFQAIGIEPMGLLTRSARHGRAGNGGPSALFSATTIAVAVALGVVLENVAKHEAWRPTFTAASRLAFLSPLSNEMDLRRKVLLDAVSSRRDGEFYASPLLAEVLAAQPVNAQAKVSRQRLSDLLNGEWVRWELRDMSDKPIIRAVPAAERLPVRNGIDPQPEPCFKDFYRATPNTRTWPDGIGCVMVAKPEARDRLPLAVNAYFYAAKNEVFRHDNYFQELKLIEDRENFVRAFALLCLLCAIAALIAAIYLRFRKEPAGRLVGTDARAPRTTGNARSALFFAVALLVGYAVAAGAYSEEANELYIRVFGYYVALSP
jgi:hypothetical protein